MMVYKCRLSDFVQATATLNFVWLARLNVPKIEFASAPGVIKREITEQGIGSGIGG